MIEKYQQIVKKLISLTDEGRIEWEKTSGNEYKVGIGNNYISVLYHEGSPRSPYLITAPDVSFVKLLLWNQNGELLDEVKVENREYGSNDYELLRNLYIAARRSNGKVYEMLDAIITELDNAKKES